MLSKLYRLPLREMKDYFQVSKKKRFSSFLLYSLASTHENPRFAVSIKSQGTTAVLRNRLKRVVRAMIESEVEHIKVADYVFAVHTLKEKDLKKDIQTWLNEVVSIKK